MTLQNLKNFFTRRRAAFSVAAGVLVHPAPAVETDDEDRYRPLQWPLVRRLLKSLVPFKKRYITAICLGLVHVFLDMQSPQFIKRISDYGADYSAGRLSGI